MIRQYVYIYLLLCNVFENLENVHSRCVGFMNFWKKRSTSPCTFYVTNQLKFGIKKYFQQIYNDHKTNSTDNLQKPKFAYTTF